MEKAEEIFMEEMPICPIYHWNMPYMIQPHLKHVAMTPIGDLVFENLAVDERKATLKSIVPYPSSLSFPRYAVEMEGPTHLIKPTYSPRGISTIEFDAYVAFIEQILRSILPEELVIALSTKRDDAAIKKMSSY